MKSKFVLFLLFPVFCFSQQKILNGKVETGSMLEGIFVVNLNKEIQVKTDGFGKFSIYADEGDLLVFSAVFIKRKRFLVEKEHLENEMIIPLEQQQIEIETVEIERININSEDLGLVPKGQKRYTPAERRLKTATDMDLMIGLGFAFSLDPILNAISGRTKMLKQQLEIERFNKNVQLTQQYFSDEYLISEFNIPEDYTLDFRMYLVDNSEFLKIMKTGQNLKIVSFAFSLLEEYKNLISDEN